MESPNERPLPPRHRLDVRDRFEQDPAFHSLTEMLTAWLLHHPSFTPTELREAAMLAATRVEALTLRDFRMDRFGNLFERASRSGAQPT